MLNSHLVDEAQLAGVGNGQNNCEEEGEAVHSVQNSVTEIGTGQLEKKDTGKYDVEEAGDDAFTDADDFELCSKTVHKVIPTTVHAVKDEKDVEDDDKEAEEDLKGGGDLEELEDSWAPC